MLGELNEINKQIKKARKRRTEILLGLILIVFIIYKFSLYNYFSFVVQKDAKLIINDFERNYLYSQSLNIEVYKGIKNEILSGSYTTKEKLDKLFQTAKNNANDNYTVFKYADIFKGNLGYSAYKKMRFKSKVVSGDTIYVKMDSFGDNAGEKFYKALEKLKNKEYLIIDIRDNSRGDYSEAVEIADLLIAEESEICAIETMKSKHYYNSDAFLFDFKKIFILVNENTASSAEMLALSLKESLGDKVELIGKTTAQKPIGQIYKEYYNKIEFDIVSLKWSVKGKSAEALSAYIEKYSNMSFEKLDDYMTQVNALR